MGQVQRELGGAIHVVTTADYVLARFPAGELQICCAPTHVVAGADLMDIATRGKGQASVASRTLVTVTRPRGCIVKDRSVLGYVVQNQLAPLN